jgi:hypothetical protein
MTFAAPPPPTCAMRVVRDLLGPAGGSDEELNQYEDHVYQRYLLARLRLFAPIFHVTRCLADTVGAKVGTTSD